jgi:lysophospholipase L1-like esterase
MPIRVACVGDSITEGTEYPNDLWRLLGANYTVGNFGVGGASVSLDAPTPYMREAAFQDAKKFQPNIVIIMLGANDAQPDLHRFNTTFVNDYLRLVSEFQALASKPKIWIVKPPPIFNNGTVENWRWLHNGTGLSTEYFILNVIPSVEKVANEANLPIIDVYSALVNHSDYFPDGVHPDINASKLIADEYTGL